MNMNSVSVHTSNKTLIAKQGHLLLAGIVMSSLLSACGGSSGPSAEELAVQSAAAAQIIADKAAAQAAADKAAAQAAADKAAAQAAADKAAAQAVADRQAALVAARQQISVAVSDVDTEAKAAQSASSAASVLAVQAGQQASGYDEVAVSLASTNAYAAQAKTEAERAVAQKEIVAKAKADAESAQDLEAMADSEKQAQDAVATAKKARLAAEEALASTRTAAQKVADEVVVAQASRRYTKLDAGGNALPSSATSWSCVQDKTTGYVWEEKTNDSGLRDKDWRYRHMHNYGGYGGLKDTNGQTLCQGLGTCDAYSYMYAVNGTGLCGRNTWRIPLPKELGTIAQINSGSTPPHIDTNFFPETANIPTKGAYCTENVDGAEHNYQGVDFGLPILYSSFPNESPANVLGVSILVPLRFYGEIQDGLLDNPGNASNWICYTRLMSSN